MTQPQDDDNSDSFSYDSDSDNGQLTQVVKGSKSVTTPKVNCSKSVPTPMGTKSGKAKSKFVKPTQAEMDNLETNLSNNNDMLR